MSIKLSALAVDPQRSTAGVWIPFRRGAELLIARLGTRDHRAFLAQAWNAKKAELGRDPNDEEARRIDIEGVARHVLLNWRGVLSDDDQELVYNPEIGMNVLMSPDYESLLAFVEQEASRLENFARDTAKVAAGK